MPDVAVPVTLSGKVYQLRYTYPDFKAMEMELGIGYVHFLRHEIFKSATAVEVYLWAGLKKEIPETGQWVPAFPQTPEGREQVGALLWEDLRQTGDLVPICNSIFEAFTTTGPWKKAGPNAKDQNKGASPKNLKT